MREFSEKDERKFKYDFKKLLTSSETNNQTNKECLPKFIQMDNASSSIKTANMMQTYVSSRADLKQTWYRQHLLFTDVQICYQMWR